MRPRRSKPLGRLTRQPLPAPDASIDALSDEERTRCGIMWAGRSQAEAHAALSFRYLAPVLARLGEPDLAVRAARAISDEERHAEIAHHVATAYLGRAPDRGPAASLIVPAHPGADEALRDTLHVLGQCALNETTACAFIERCLESANAPLPRAALREFLADDIDHARIGWAHLASERLPPSRRERIAAWLPSMLASNHRTWSRHPDVLPALAAHGCIPAAAVQAAVREAMRELILPGFAREGVDVTAARRWYEGLPGI